MTVTVSVANGDASLEARMLDLPDLGDRKSGALPTIYRHLGDHFKVGVGYRTSRSSPTTSPT